MSKKANPKLIGIFVLVAVALLVAGLMIFGSGRFFQEKNQYVLFFEGSIKGLTVGAPVTLKGVKIGSVIAVKVLFDPELLSFQTPVYIEILPGSISNVEDASGKVERLYQVEENTQEAVDLFIQRGLRASVDMQSLVTGKLQVALDFHPGTPVYLVGQDKRYPEIPTIPSQMQKLAQSLAEIRIDELVDAATHAVKRVDFLLSMPEMEDAIKNLDQTLAEASKLARNLDREVEPLSTSVQATLKDARKVLRNADGQLTRLGPSLAETSEAATETFTTLNEEVIGERAALRFQLLETLTELRDAASAIRQLAETLDQQPDALIRGKRSLPEGK
jgi:paraquat-inducible protein B